MFKRTVFLAAIALLAIGTLGAMPTQSWAQTQLDGLGGHSLAPGLGDNAAPAQSAGGGAQMSYTRWIAWSFVSTVVSADEPSAITSNGSAS